MAHMIFSTVRAPIRLEWNWIGIFLPRSFEFPVTEQSWAVPDVVIIQAEAFADKPDSYGAVYSLVCIKKVS